MRAALATLEKRFILACVIAIFAGMAWPAPGQGLGFLLRPLLIVILFLTALRIDFGMMKGHFKRPFTLAGTVVLLMVVFPLGFYLVSLLVAPRYALGLLIMAAMPAGMASTAFVMTCGGEGALALIITFLTSLIAPVTVPLLVNLSGEMPGEDFYVMAAKMLDQSFLLIYTLLAPIAAACIVKKRFPALVERGQWAYGGGVVATLVFLIWIAMSIGAECVFSDTASSLALLAYLFGYSGIFHILGYFMMPHLETRQKTALSVGAAYVNNAMAIVFARVFFPERPEVMLPAVLLELPMTVMLLPLKYLTARARKNKKAPGGEETADA